MLDNASTIHAEQIDQSKLSTIWKVDLQHDGAVAVIVVPTKDLVVSVGEDRCEFGGDGVTSLRVVWAVLDQVDGNVGVEGFDDLLVGIPELC